jgi:DNA-binding PadR family transcriptional regulator
VGSPLRNSAPAAGRLPLTPQVFQILLSLSDQALHGYAIIADIAERTSGEIRLTASTLYDALARLVDQGLIDERDTPPAGTDDHDARRRYYELSALGREVARLEASRLQRLIDMARQKNLAPSSGPGKPRGRR